VPALILNPWLIRPELEFRRSTLRFQDFMRDRALARERSETQQGDNIQENNHNFLLE